MKQGGKKYCDGCHLQIAVAENFKEYRAENGSFILVEHFHNRSRGDCWSKKATQLLNWHAANIVAKRLDAQGGDPKSPAHDAGTLIN